MLEEWRDIPEWEGYYQASNRGRIRSVERIVPHDHDSGARRMRAKILNPFPASTPDKRPIVALSRNGQVQKHGVHVLIARAFHGQPPANKPMALHRDGNVQHNAPGNLYWGDNSENVYDSVRHGTHWEANKVDCPHGHALTIPNLKPFQLRVYNRRQCRACAIGQAWASRRICTDIDRRRYADEKYQEIMA